MVIRRGRGGGAAADVFRPSSLGRGYALQHHCASPHAVCACSPSGSSLPIGLATAYTISAAWQRHLVPISLAARGGVGPSRAIPPYLFGKSLHAVCALPWCTRSPLVAWALVCSISLLLGYHRMI